MQNHKKTISRRTFVSGLLATATLPAWTQAIASSPDVVIVGAGSAGLAAAQALIAAGKSVVVVEAANRIGGRAFTESETFGIPFDHGCSWITGGSNLPYTKMARQWNFELLQHLGAGDAFFVDGKPASGSQERKYYRAYDRVESLLDAAGSQGRDVAASSLIPTDLEYAGVAQTWIGPLDFGVDFKDLSTLDFAEYGTVLSNYLVREGYGSIVARFGAGMPVKLNTPATRIDWSGNGVSVETPAGKIRARACIITVSTGVLDAGVIRFTPELPGWKLAAVHNLPMGLLAKIPLQFDGERFGLKANQWLTYAVSNEMPAEACYFLTWPFDSNLMIGWVGGEFGWQLSANDPRAAVDFALGELVKLFGSDLRRHFVRGLITDWANNPWVRGAYAAARPGQYQARQEIQRPVGERLFFAGEATAAPYYMLCAGAYTSGERAAREVIGVIG